MDHVTDDQLYPLFYALVRHKKGEKRIAKLKLGTELSRCLNGLPDKHFEQAPGLDDMLSAEEIRRIVTHATECNECAIKVLEDGAAAKRKKTEADLAADEKRREDKERKLKIKFFVSLAYGSACVVGAREASVRHNLILLEKAKEQGLAVGRRSGPEIHPLQILFVVLICVAAWGLAECWQIATTLWIDFTKAKRAVPVIGKAWAERSERKKQEWLEAQRDRERQ